MDFVDFFLFQIYPYIALGIFAIGCWARFDWGAYTWRSGSSQLLSPRGMRLGSNAFHIGILAILGGHLVGLLTPHWLYEYVISVENKQLLAMIVGGVFGLVCLLGMTILLLRRLLDVRIRATGGGRDLAVLVLLYAQLLLGLSSIFVSAQHLDGSEMLALSGWAQHVVTFRPGAAALVAGTHWIFKAHITLGLTLILITPFTRLVHIWSIPLSYLRRPYQVVRRRQPAVDYAKR
ncbi:MAG: respiratory nitrate reductase subunit gamma [Proteobacteria bacterium]|nr:respiratory nitrate reductase subunit gamma [Pseudomonadota bacterium]